MNIQQLYKFFEESNGVSTDTRTLKPGQLYFALKGPNFNGNKLALTALEAGAHKAIVDEHIGVDDKRLIRVDDVLTTLQQLARYHRDQLNTIVIGITGTNGKTTSKELIYQVLSSQYPTIATQGNLNNHIGVPLTVLSITHDHDFAVVEMGANHKGEIAELCEICDPTFGYVTNVGKAHLEGFGSFENIIITKKGLYDYVSRHNGTLFMNRKNSELLGIPEYHKVVYFGQSDDDFCQGRLLEGNSFVSAEIIGFEGTIRVNTQLIGAYNLDNILAAACIGSYFEVPLQKIRHALESYTPSNNRSQFVQTDKNKLFLDAYNANPSSMELAVTHFATDSAENKMAILGDMFELGNESAFYHNALVELCQKKGLDCWFVGKHFKSIENSYGRFFESTEAAIEVLKSEELRNKTLLIKGSRGVQLEKLVPYL